MAPRKNKDKNSAAGAPRRSSREAKNAAKVSKRAAAAAAAAAAATASASASANLPAPAKFGLEHFFGRSSQSSQPAHMEHNPSASNNSLNGAKDTLNGDKTPIDKVVPCSRTSPDPDSKNPPVSDVSSPPLRRFSPSVMIKQTQDDGGEEITYNKTPVIDRLRSLKNKRSDSQAQAAVLRSCSYNGDHDMDKILLNAPILNCTPVRNSPEEESSSGKAAIYQQLFSSPTVKGWKQRSQSMQRVADKSKRPDDKESHLICTNEKFESLQSQKRKESLKERVAKGQRKDLLELIDTAEDVLRVEKPVPKWCCTKSAGPINEFGSVPVSINDEKIINKKQHTDQEASKSGVTDHTLKCSEGLEFVSNTHLSIQPSDAFADMHSVLQNIHFLVLEVDESELYENQLGIKSPSKFLLLLNEETGSEKAVILCGKWVYSEVRVGDTVNVIGDFDAKGKCVIDDDQNLLIVNPDLLISGSRVASSFTCLRRAVLDERIKSQEVSASALLGTMLHQIFQVALLQEFPTKASLEEEVRIVMLEHIDSIYATGDDEREVFAKLTSAIPALLSWIDAFKGKSKVTRPFVDFGPRSEEKQITISEVVDIEEMVWSPKYGLKGMFDASVRVDIGSCGMPQDSVMMPLEFKTGRRTTGQAAVDHRAQVILYNLLMSDRYIQDLGYGLIYYLHTNQMQGVNVQHADLIGLIMQRNRYASSLLNVSSTQKLPPMLKSYSMCQGCRHLETCTIYHKAHECGNAESSGLGETFDSLVSHLSDTSYEFICHWDRLIDLEAEDSLTIHSEIWRKPSALREKEGGCLSSMILDQSYRYSKSSISGVEQYLYRFHRQDLIGRKRDYLEIDTGSVHNTRLTSSSGNQMELAFKPGDHVILSTEDGRIAIASGVVMDISYTYVTVSVKHHLRLGGTSEDELRKQVWRIDKDEIASSYGIMRFNLLQLFVKSNCDDHCRRLIVDLRPPRFDSGAVLSQDPAVSYIRSVTDINDDQRRAIYKILAAKDYALIHGMPGTGKTSTMVHAVKALLTRGSSILLTSYTNSAIDNLLLKLKAQLAFDTHFVYVVEDSLMPSLLFNISCYKGIDFLRLGRHGAIHPGIQDHTIKGMGITSVKALESKVEQACVVGVTCLGITHPLLAKKKFDICIVDEAGQITLPVCLGPLMYAQTFVLVGDHYQLPPLVRSAEAREKGMGISLFRRLSEAHPQAVSALQIQYRMCAGVMKLSNALIYCNRLRCGSTAVAEARLEIANLADINPPWLQQTLDPTKAVAFLDTDLLPAPESKEHNAVNNPIEAFILLKIVRGLVKGGVSVDDIGVISTYNSQVDLIRTGAAEIGLQSMEVHTIDRYQGRDKDCILVSFVRSNFRIKHLGSSLVADWHRINVAITRAKKKLIMIGSRKTLSTAPLLKILVEQVEQQGGILDLPAEILSSSPQLKKCTSRLVT